MSDSVNSLTLLMVAFLVTACGDLSLSRSCEDFKAGLPDRYKFDNLWESINNAHREIDDYKVSYGYGNSVAIASDDSSFSDSDLRSIPVDWAGIGLGSAYHVYYHLKSDSVNIDLKRRVEILKESGFSKVELGSPNKVLIFRGISNSEFYSLDLECRLANSDHKIVLSIVN